MTPAEKDVREAWTCDDRRPDGCRNPHGCHCAEIGSLLARAQSAEQERDKLAKAVEINHDAAIKASQEVVALQAERDRLRDLIARGYPAMLARAETAEAALNEARADVIGLGRAALERRSGDVVGLLSAALAWFHSERPQTRSGTLPLWVVDGQNALSAFTPTEEG